MRDTHDLCQSAGCNRQAANYNLYTEKHLCPICWEAYERQFPVSLLDKEKAEKADIKACYEAIKKARIIHKKPVQRRKYGTTYTNIPMEMWEVLQPVIEMMEEPQ